MRRDARLIFRVLGGNPCHAATNALTAAFRSGGACPVCAWSQVIVSSPAALAGTPFVVAWRNAQQVWLESYTGLGLASWDG